MPVRCPVCTWIMYRAFDDMFTGTEYVRTISSLVYNERGAQFFTSTHELMFAKQRYGQCP